jgi:hypothetical protein
MNKPRRTDNQSPEDNAARFRNRLRGLCDRRRAGGPGAGTVTRAGVEAKVAAWIAYARNADAWRLS